MEKTKEKRGLGDNSNINTENYSSPLERNYWKDVADEACRLIEYAMNNVKLFNGKIIVPDMKSAKIGDIF